MFGLIYGDLVQYKDFFKRSAGAGSNGSRFRTDEYMLNYINSRSRSYSDTLENGYKEYDGTLNTAIIQENTVSSIYAEDFVKALVKEGVPLETAEKYLKMDEADGQGYISFDSYRLLKTSNASWTTEQEELYQKIVKGEKPSGSEIAEYFPPMKPHYYGPLKTDGLPIQAFHKYSLAPMIPTVIKGTTMEKLHTKMIKEGVDYVTFKSGSKVGSHTKQVKDSDGKIKYEFDKYYEDISDRSKSTPLSPHDSPSDHLTQKANS